MDVHSHKCDDCGRIWTHDRDKFPPGNKAYDQAHTCICGAMQFNKYFKDDEEMYNQFMKWWRRQREREEEMT